MQSSEILSPPHRGQMLGTRRWLFKACFATTSAPIISSSARSKIIDRPSQVYGDSPIGVRGAHELDE
jgi:hypothetical protein